REKLMRLQHENKMLKQHSEANEGSSRLPVLQAMVSDLQERHNQTSQENRWGKTRKSSLPGLTILPKQTVKSYFDSTYKLEFDTSRKLKMFKRNLKWFSESDLLILRQPKGFLSSNFLSSSPLTPCKALTLPASSSRIPNNSNEKPIVIRHIHEFKMPPSPTNEDSGCCRTSPSSCEGCEDHGRPEVDSPEYSGTLDSGISCVYRCLSPVIPSIVEECTTHHVSDILPALSDASPSPVFHHVHPSHENCVYCWSPNNSQGDDIEGSGRDSRGTESISPLPLRPHTVCSYNTPNSYSKSTSPLPLLQSSNLLVSPPQPHATKMKIVSSSLFSLPTTSSEHLYSAPPQSLSDSCFHTTTNGNTDLKLSASFNSSSQSASDSQSCSSPQGRRSSGFNRSSHTPESPTPHNSPRLPNSINATRNRSTKNSSPPMLKDITSAPVAQNTLLNKSSYQVSNFEEDNSKNSESSSYRSLLNKSQRFSESGDSSPCRSSRSGDERHSTEESVYVQKHSDINHYSNQSNRSSMSSKDSDGNTSELDTNNFKKSKEGSKIRSISVPRHRNMEYGNLVKNGVSPKQERNRSVPRPSIWLTTNKTNQEITSKSKVTKCLPNGNSLDNSKPFSELRGTQTKLEKTTLTSSGNSNQSIHIPKSHIYVGRKPDLEKSVLNNCSNTAANISAHSNHKASLLTKTYDYSPSSSLLNRRELLSTSLDSTKQSSNMKTFSQSEKLTFIKKTSSLMQNVSDDSLEPLSPLQPYYNSKNNNSIVNSSETFTDQPKNRPSLMKNISPNTSIANSNKKVDPLHTLTARNNTKTSTSKQISSSKENWSNCNKQSPTKSCINSFGSLKQDQNRNVKFREPIVSQVTINSDMESVSSKYSPTSPRERISPLQTPSKVTESSQIKLENKSSSSRFVKSADNRFALSNDLKLIKPNTGELCLSTTDTETDHDTLERRLTLGMYAAPLVSSESCTSISHDEQDGDPSATDYCTENGSEYEDYNPKQFKAFTNEDFTVIKKNIEVEKGSEDEKLNEKQKKELENINNSDNDDRVTGDNIEEDSEELLEISDASNLASTYKFFRKQNKIKSVKNQPKIAAMGGIVKRKNKTKKVVSETINAMFTLCTP
ncbi:unnamed protein product, partial [Meganyctiphanes norvegica]